MQNDIDILSEIKNRPTLTLSSAIFGGQIATVTYAASAVVTYTAARLFLLSHDASFTLGTFIPIVPALLLGLKAAAESFDIACIIDDANQDYAPNAPKPL